MLSFGKTAVVMTAVAATSAFAVQSAEAGTVTHRYTVLPGDLYSNVGTTAGVVGDGTEGNGSWHVNMGTSGVDYFYPEDTMYSGLGFVPDITIRDIVRMSIDTKRSGGYEGKDFTIQIETGDGTDSSPFYSAINFATNQDDSTEVKQSDYYDAGEWNTYEWNIDGNDSDGLEGTLEQSENGSDDGGNSQTNPWLTLKETIDRDAFFQVDSDPSNDGYYGWLDERIAGIKISARGDGYVLDSQLDNFTFSYLDDAKVVQEFVIDFEAVPSPAAVSVGIVGLGAMLLRRRREA